MTMTGSQAYSLDHQPPCSLGLQKHAGWFLISSAWLGTLAFAALAGLAFLIDTRLLEVSFASFKDITNYLIVGRDVMFLASGIAAMVWLYQAYKRLPGISGRENQRKTWWAWAGILIPVANFFVPFRISRELIAGSRDGLQACSTRVVGLAQCSVAVSLLTVAAIAILNQANVLSNSMALTLLGTSALANAIACIAWTIIVLETNRAQRESLA